MEYKDHLPNIFETWKLYKKELNKMDDSENDCIITELSLRFTFKEHEGDVIYGSIINTTS